MNASCPDFLSYNCGRQVDGFKEVEIFKWLVLALVSTTLYQIFFTNDKKLALQKRDMCSRDASLNGVSSLPGPKPFPFRLIGNLFQLPVVKEIIPTCFKWCKKYGPCFRLTLFWEDFIIISNAALAKTILSSNDIGLGHLKKTDVYHFLQGIDGLAFASGNWWRQMRKHVEKVFAYKKLLSQIAIYNVHADKLVSIFGSSNHKSPELEVANCTVQMIIDAFISKPGTCSYDESMEYMKCWKRYTEITAHRIIHPWLGIKWLWKCHPMSLELDQSIGTVKEFAASLIERYKMSSKNREESCLISELLRIGYSFKEIQSEVVSLLFAHETNSLGLYYLLYMLAAHPEHQAKCQEEVDQLFEDRDDFYISYDDLSKLKYLERCLLESMRLLPPVFIFGRKLESDLQLTDGVMLPKGTNCLILPIVIQRMAEYYDNPEVFNPDNFLPEVKSKRPAYAYLPFSAGPRICLGMKASMVNVKIVAAKILKHFTITSPYKLEELTFRLNLTMSTEQDLDLKFCPRT